MHCGSRVWRGECHYLLLMTDRAWGRARSRNLPLIAIRQQHTLSESDVADCFAGTGYSRSPASDVIQRSARVQGGSIGHSSIARA